jgi:hypothetical protein
MNKEPKVIFITCIGRSGSTIIANILGQYEHSIHIGELNEIWERGYKNNFLCGCHQPFQECLFWTDIINNEIKDSEELEKLISVGKYLRSTQILFFLKAIIFRRNRSLKIYANHIKNIYLNILTNTNKTIIIDSTKYTSYGYMLKFIKNIDFHIIHLIRDPRAVAYSWSKIKVRENRINEKEYMPRKSILRTTITYLMSYVFAKIYFKNKKYKYTILRYEDFIKDPEYFIEKIMNRYKTNTPDSLFPCKNSVNLNTISHTITGNPIRFNLGTTQLKLDDKWKMKLNPKDEKLIKFLSWPLMFKHGYL